METYWNILEKVKGSSLRLTKLDDEIYTHLTIDFPEFDPAEPIDEDKMKSKAGKERWRKFLMAYEKRVDDYNFGTMLRTDPKLEYTQHDTIFGKSRRRDAINHGKPCFSRRHGHGRGRGAREKGTLWADNFRPRGRVV